jgi:hypothetical protein
MGIRDWIGNGQPDEIRALGEYDAASYPRDLVALLGRRQEVAEQLLRIDVADPEKRVEAIPHLRTLLRTYPHPLAYELLLNAYLDDGRFDEAKGVAFAAQARRKECEASEHPEVRDEVEHLSAWTPEAIDRLRTESGSA